MLALCSALYGPRPEKTLTLLHGNKGADKPAHLRTLVSAFVICYLESAIVQLAQSMPNFTILASLCGSADWFELEPRRQLLLQ